MSQNSDKDLGGRLLNRLQRKPRPDREVEPPVLNKGLTRTGEAVLIGSTIILLTSPCIAMVLVGLAMVPEFMGAEPAHARHIPPTLNRSMKRDGKDVLLTVVVDNSRSSTQIDTAEFRGDIAHVKPERAPVVQAIPPGGSERVVLRFKNVPRGDWPFRIECDYTYPGGSDSLVETHGKFAIP